MTLENGWTDEVARNSGTNSSPVLSVSHDDVLTYANAASWIVLKTWGASLSRTIPPALQSVVDEARRTGCTQDRTLVAGLVSVHLVFVPLAGDGSVLILGADTTASRQSDKDRLIKAHVYMQVREAIVVMDDEFRTVDLNAETICAERMTGDLDIQLVSSGREITVVEAVIGRLSGHRLNHLDKGMPVSQGINRHSWYQGSCMPPIGTDTLEIPTFEIASLTS